MRVWGGIEEKRWARSLVTLGPGQVELLVEIAKLERSDKVVQAGLTPPLWECCPHGGLLPSVIS